MHLKVPLTIGALARAAGVSVETVRFYQRKQLLREPPKPYGGIRRYDMTDVGRLRFIKSAKQLGFSLEDVRELLRLQDGTHCNEAARLAEQKLSEVRGKLAELSRMEAVLATLVEACHANNRELSCPLIAALEEKPQWPRPDREKK